MWFTLLLAVGRISTTGVVTLFDLQPQRGLNGIVSGPDGNLWFIESNTRAVGRISTDGKIAEFPIAAESFLKDLSFGADGNLWVLEGERVFQVLIATTPVELQSFTAE